MRNFLDLDGLYPVAKLGVALRVSFSDGVHNLHALNHLAKDRVAVVEQGAEADRVETWLGSTLRSAISDVLGYPELAGEDAVETTIGEAWGDG